MKIEKSSENRTTTVHLIGQFQASDLGKLKTQREGSGALFALDLEEVTVVDVEVVRFLAECEANEVKMRIALGTSESGSHVNDDPETGTTASRTKCLSSTKKRTDMRAMRAEQFSGYEGLKLVELPKPAASDGKVLLRITAAGVTPLDHTILSGQFHHSKSPLVLGNEGAGVVAEGGGTDFPVGSRVMFFGPYGAFEDGAYSEWLAVRKEDLCLIPDNIDDVSAAGIPVAYLTAQVALTLAGFRAGKTVLAPAIGGSIGNAVTQLARALGTKHAMSSTTNHAKAEQAKRSDSMKSSIPPWRSWGTACVVSRAVTVQTLSSTESVVTS